MATTGGPIIPGVSRGLIFFTDPANPESYPDTGTTLFNLVDVTSNATLVNGLIFSGYSKGSNFTLDGTSDYINLPSSLEALHGSTEASVSIWTKLNRSSNSSVRSGIIQLTGFNSGNGCLYFYTDSARVGGIWLDTFLTTRYYTGDWAPTFDATNWHNLTITCRPGTNGWKMYLNGILKYQNVGPSTVSVTTERGINLGRNSLSRELWGNLGPCYIYNKALTAEEVLQNYNATKGRFGL